MFEQSKNNNHKKQAWFWGSFLATSLLSPILAPIAWAANRLETFVFDVDESRIEFVTKDKVRPMGKIIENPTRLVIDLPGTTYKGPTLRRDVGNGVRSVRVGQPEPDMTRMVIEFDPNYQLHDGPLRMKAMSTPSRWAIQLPESVAKSGDLSNAPFVWPLIGEITSGFGWRVHPISGDRKLHKGIDVAAPTGAPILAAADGIVTFADWDDGGYGNVVELTHADGSLTLYAHTSKILVSKGQQVRQGQPIAQVGSTGWSTGPHLHFEVQSGSKKILDPMAFLPLRYVVFNIVS
jgi:hypothetical protein